MAPTIRQRTLPGFEDQPASPAAAIPPQSPAASARAQERLQPESLAGRAVYVVDAHSLLYQLFHALPEMTGPAGQPVGAMHGFLRDILDLLEKRHPDYLFCAFDAPGRETFRHAAYPQYKAHRPETPPDLQAQIPNVRRCLAALGIPCLEHARYEADDILATIARQTKEQGGTCFLVTTDKDCRQLLDDRVKLYDIRKDAVSDAESLRKQWGIRPDQVVDFLALVGDPVDNVPGVPLIGRKTAGELLARYGTLEEVVRQAAQVEGGRRRENLLGFGGRALHSRSLLRLEDRVPVEIDWSRGRVGQADREAALALCREFGFRRLAERIAAWGAPALPSAWAADYRTVATLAEFEALVEQMRRQSRIAIDTETTSPQARFAELVGCSFAWREGEAYYVPWRAPPGEPQVDRLAAAALLRPLLEDRNVQKVGQNLKYDAVVLRQLGARLEGLAFDTMVADYLLSPGERSHSLGQLAERHLGHATLKISELIGQGRAQRRMDEVPVAAVTAYAGEDADVSLRLAGILERKLSEAGLDGLFHQIEMPLIEVLADMEYLGIRVDVPRLRELSRRFGERLAALEAEIHELAGKRFNIDSRQQLAAILFGELHLPVLKRTKTGPSTDAEVLSELARLHPLPAKIIEYRQNAKLKSTYVDALPDLVHPETGRVHTSFQQDVAATGRLSSSDPNLQNIPVRTAEGREIRSAFIPGEEGWQLLSADYSQIELRVLAHFSGDEALRQAFAEDRDVHRQVASEVYGVPLSEVTPAMRRSAKAVNFGVIYGQSPFGLAKSLGIDKEEAARFIDTYFARFVGVDKFIARVLEECWRNGYVSSILGRRRAVQGVRDPTRTVTSRQRNLPERIAINTVIQGSAADLIKQAMINVHRRLRRQPCRARMLLQIHDELVFEVPSDEVAALASLVTEEMTAAGRLDVPLKVDVRAGANWAECETIG